MADAKHDAVAESATFPDDASEGKGAVVVPRVELPEVLRNLSEDELKALEDKIRRKADIRLLPTMIIICE